MNAQEAVTAWRASQAQHELRGIHLPDVQMYVPDEWKHNFNLAMDALPPTSTHANSAVPFILTTMIDPQVIHVAFAPTKAAEVLGENQRGTWLDETIMFPLVEYAGEVSSYGDRSANGRASVNSNWPQRQSYLYQTMKEYGERELERAGLAKINWVSELDKSAALALNKFSNFTYLFGVRGLQNYGLTNDPALTAPITAGTKAAGGTAWITPATGQPNGTANEVYADIQALYYRLVQQTGGLVTQDSAMKLVMSPTSEVALLTTNSFNVNVGDLLKKNFSNLKVVTVIEYGVQGPANPLGIAAGNLLQLIADEVEGQNTGFCAFNEKMRNHKLIPLESSFRQKVTGGSWGAVIRQPFAIAQMIGI